MLDIKRLRKDPNLIEKKLQSKDPQIELKSVLELDERIREIKLHVEEKKSKRNHFSKEIGDKKRKGEDTSSLMEQVSGLGSEIALLDEELKEKETLCTHKLSLLPNLPFEDIPISHDPKDNVCIKSVGEKPSFSFPFKNHVELNEKLSLFDFKRGAKISGSGWPVYKGMGARLEWALLNYMLDIHLDNGFEFYLPPHLVRPDIMYGSGQLPKFAKQLFQLHDNDYPLYLLPTAEVALNGLHYDEIVQSSDLPLKYVSYTPCFRREAGAAGSGERGLIRMHQFNKVEMFAFTHPEKSDEMFNEMLKSAETILQGLGIHYRLMLLVTGDMSFAASKTVDIEVFLPGQGRYYEVSSISNCTDFQARRSAIRYKSGEEKPEFVHTLNGSGLATSRLMVALLENFQEEDGSITLPLALHRYLNGIKKICPTS